MGAFRNVKPHVIAYLTSATVALVTNIVVAVTMFSTKKLRRRCLLIAIALLAVADNIATISYNAAVQLGLDSRQLCAYFEFEFVATNYAILGIFGGASYQRYMHIHEPLKISKLLTFRRQLAVTLICIFVPYVILLPTVVKILPSLSEDQEGKMFHYDRERALCSIQWMQTHDAIFWILQLLVVLPSILITVYAWLRILVVVHKHIKRISQYNRNDRSKSESSNGSKRTNDSKTWSTIVESVGQKSRSIQRHISYKMSSSSQSLSGKNLSNSSLTSVNSQSRLSDYSSGAVRLVAFRKLDESPACYMPQPTRETITWPSFEADLKQELASSAEILQDSTIRVRRAGVFDRGKMDKPTKDNPVNFTEETTENEKRKALEKWLNEVNERRESINELTSKRKQQLRRWSSVEEIDVGETAACPEPEEHHLNGKEDNPPTRRRSTIDTVDSGVCYTTDTCTTISGSEPRKLSINAMRKDSETEELYAGEKTPGWFKTLAIVHEPRNAPGRLSSDSYSSSRSWSIDSSSSRPSAGSVNMMFEAGRKKRGSNSSSSSDGSRPSFTSSSSSALSSLRAESFENTALQAIPEVESEIDTDENDAIKLTTPKVGNLRRPHHVGPRRAMMKRAVSFDEFLTRIPSHRRKSLTRWSSHSSIIHLQHRIKKLKGIIVCCVFVALCLVAILPNASLQIYNKIGQRPTNETDVILQWVSTLLTMFTPLLFNAFDRRFRRTLCCLGKRIKTTIARPVTKGRKNTVVVLQAGRTRTRTATH